MIHVTILSMNVSRTKRYIRWNNYFRVVEPHWNQDITRHPGVNGCHCWRATWNRNYNENSKYPHLDMCHAIRNCCFGERGWHLKCEIFIKTLNDKKQSATVFMKHHANLVGFVTSTTIILQPVNRHCVVRAKYASFVFQASASITYARISLSMHHLLSCHCTNDDNNIRLSHPCSIKVV